jgi:hypothetical protein
VKRSDSSSGGSSLMQRTLSRIVTSGSAIDIASQSSASPHKPLSLFL